MATRSRVLLAIVLGCGSLAPPLALGFDDVRKPQVPALKVERYTLPNGLTVLLHEDHKTPVAAVNLYYKVGSKDEKTGKTGFAHLFEHMMFLGSRHHDADYSLPLERLGAETNATTDEDRTEYYERVPSNALERALWLEADRMGFLLPAMTRRSSTASGTWSRTNVASAWTTSRTAAPTRRSARRSTPRTTPTVTA